MPTSDHSDDVVDEVYKQTEEIIDENGKGQIKTMIMGDFNSVVGEGCDGNIVGTLGIWERKGGKISRILRAKWILDFKHMV